MTLALDPEKALYGPKFLSGEGSTSGLLDSKGFVDSATITAAAGAWQTVLDITGEGVLVAAAAKMSSGAAAVAINLRITLDGVQYTGQRVATSNSSIWVTTFGVLSAYDGGAGPSYLLSGGPVLYEFLQSLKIEAMRSASGASPLALWTHFLRRN